MQSRAERREGPVVRAARILLGVTAITTAAPGAVYVLFYVTSAPYALRPLATDDPCAVASCQGTVAFLALLAGAVLLATVALGFLNRTRQALVVLLGWLIESVALALSLGAEGAAFFSCSSGIGAGLIAIPEVGGLPRRVPSSLASLVAGALLVTGVLLLLGLGEPCPNLG